MTAESSPLDRYPSFIDTIVRRILKGEIAAKARVERLLVNEVEAGTGELFERCLEVAIADTQKQLDNHANEAKQAKAGRSLRALQTIQSAWETCQQNQQSNRTVDTLVQNLAEADPSNCVRLLLQAIELSGHSNRGLETEQLQLLATSLKQTASSNDKHTDLMAIATGIQNGLTARQSLETHLVSWMYEQGQDRLGFTSDAEAGGPWSLWARECRGEAARSLFTALNRSEAPQDWCDREPITLTDWIELVLVLQGLQRGLTAWLDRQPYNPQAGKKISVVTFLTFASLWSQLSQGWEQATPGSPPSKERAALVQASFQIALQILRDFASRDYFPLYGGIFILLSGPYLQTVLDDLDRPLQAASDSREKGRILTLLGYSQRIVRHYDRARELHQQALDLARETGDRPSEIANLNHLSRTDLARQRWQSAEDYAQRALILARETGDRPGEAAALANVGYGQIFAALQRGQLEAELCEGAIAMLQRGLSLADRQGDLQSRALCANSLGIALFVVERYEPAIATLTIAIAAGNSLGDLYLQALNFAYLARSHYGLQQFDLAIAFGSIGVYWLHQLQAEEWRSLAGLLAILRGQLGAETFQQTLDACRRTIVREIGIDGYDALGSILMAYTDSEDNSPPSD